MNTRIFSIGLLASTTLFAEKMAAQQNVSPNVILIMADDLGWGDVGFNGNPIIKTPYLDRLASEGTVFTHFYAGAPLSSPTRASVLTGRNAFRTGVFAPNEGIIRPEEKTLPEYLQAIGYETGHFGKWHLGTLTYKEKDANRGCPENRHLYNPPAEHGYDDAFVTESKVPTCDPMYAPKDNNGRFWDYIREGEPRKSYGTYYWGVDGRKVQDNLDGDDSRIIIDRVLPFIQQSVEDKKPFLATIWFHTPHLPCVAAPEYAAMYKNLSIEERNYYGCITAMDAQIERLVQYLKEQKVYDNTILLFCSDNGPELRTPGTAGAFKGKKRSLYEGGIRVPAFMVWKDKQSVFPKNISVPCSTCDYLPTLADLTGFALDKERALDGESWLDLLQGNTEHRTNPLVFCSGTQGAVVDGFYKLYTDKGKIELFDLQSDPYENLDISATYPKETERLKNYLYKQMDAYQQSFEGKEYGQESVERMKQPWHSIFEYSQRK